MNKSRLLWILVIADILLAFGSAGAEALFGWTLPPALREFQHQRFHVNPIAGAFGAFRALLLAITVLAAFGAWIGLLGFWRHARGLYLFSIATWLLFTLLRGGSVDTSVAAVFKALNGLVSGAILGLVYFTELAQRFEHRSAGRSAPVGANFGTHRA